MPCRCSRRCSDERGQVRDHRLERVPAIVERQQRVAAKGDADRLFLRRQRSRTRALRTHRVVLDEGAPASLANRLLVQVVPLGELRDRRLRSLYRRSDGVRGLGAAVEDRAHSAFPSDGVGKLPPHRGTKQLEHLPNKDAPSPMRSRRPVEAS